MTPDEQAALVTKLDHATSKWVEWMNKANEYLERNNDLNNENYDLRRINIKLMKELEALNGPRA